MSVDLPAILIPPSEGKAQGGEGPPWAPGTGALADIDDARADVLDALDRFGPPGGGVRDAPTCSASERYTGVLYQHLDWASLPPDARERGRRSVLIASGLWGMSSPDHPIPHYRLKMAARLEPLGRLSTWWRPRLTAALADHLDGRVVWDLLPNEHAAGWHPTAVPVARRITVRFVDRNGRTVSHWNKLLKGALVRHILTRQIDDPADLTAWEHPSGYRVDEVASDLGADPARLVLSERITPAPA